MEELSVRVRLDLPARPFRHFFSATGYVNVDFTTTSPTLRMFDHLSSFHNHFRFLRMHNTLTAHGQGDRFLLEGGRDFGNAAGIQSGGADAVVRLQDGELAFDWSTLDRVYDLLVEHGLRPIVETDYLPTCLRAAEELWHQPADYRLWGRAVGAFAAHLLERYGEQEVARWYFEVWNEPDVLPAWQRDPQGFLALYDAMEQAVHEVCPSFQVGGPAVTQGSEGLALFRTFLEHCNSGINHLSGRSGARVDFLSVHCKGGTLKELNPSSEMILDSLRRFREIQGRFPSFASLPLFNDESGIVWGGNAGVETASWLNFRNTHYAAGFVCKLVDRYCRVVEDELGANLGLMDIDNCQLQWERRLFSGNRSQLTPLYAYPSTDLIRKPLFNAYVLLSRLGTERLQSQCDHPGFGTKFGVLATREGERLSLMAWNFEDGIEDGVNPRRLRILLGPGPAEEARKDRPWRLVHYRIDAEHSSAYGAWAALGKPPRPTAAQVRQLREREGLELAEPVREVLPREELSLCVDLPLHAVSLLLLVPHNPAAPAPPQWVRGTAESGESGPRVFLKWRPSPEPDFLHYRLRRRTGAGRPEPLCQRVSLNTSVYTDAEVRPGERYSYAVEAVNASGAVSTPSPELRVAVPES